LTKGPDAFRTISEAADELGVPQHVLRFWETRFSFIRPMKRAGGRRFYRPQDIAVLRGVRTLLHDEGYSIKGVQRLHREQGVRRLIAAADVDAARPKPIEGAEVPAPPAQAELPIDRPASEATAPRPRRRPADLSELERRRLTAALEDLTAIKAEIDALLAQK
jgi:DNA-binding transcriptional MerR regulator